MRDNFVGHFCLTGILSPVSTSGEHSPENQMSVSQFPNATKTKAEDLFNLTEKLIPVLDPALEPDCDLIVSAYSCAMIEQVLHMQKLHMYHKLDPALMRQIKSILDSCR